MSDCEWPTIDSDLDSVLTGLLLGDGYINKLKPGQHRLVVTSKSEQFLDHLHNEWPWLFCDPYLYRDAETAAKEMDETGPSDTVNEENYSDYYRTHTVCHPHFTEMRNWYDGGEKHAPTDLKINGTAIRYWYASDGYMYFREEKYAIPRITTCGDVDRERSLVENNGMTTHSGQTRFSIAQSNTEQFFDLIGNDPVPGYEYKWATDFERYKSLRGKDYMGE